MRIAICFFGIARSIQYTAGSIERNIIEPAARFGDVLKIAYLYDVPKIENKRSGEDIALDINVNQHIALDYVEMAQPDTADILLDYQKFKVFGDNWNDNYRSLKNLTHQLHSLQQNTKMAQGSGADVVAFIRPDLHYHDSLGPIFKNALRIHRKGGSVLFSPNWQRWGGLNDRFAIAVGENAIFSYGSRLQVAEEFCSTFKCSLHSEKLLAYAIKKSGVKVRHIPQRASRVRANGVQAFESFDHFAVCAIQRRLDNRLKERSKWLHGVLSRSNEICSNLIWGQGRDGIMPPKGAVQRSHLEETKLK